MTREAGAKVVMTVPAVIGAIIVTFVFIYNIVASAQAEMRENIESIESRVNTVEKTMITRDEFTEKMKDLESKLGEARRELKEDSSNIDDKLTELLLLLNKKDSNE